VLTKLLILCIDREALEYLRNLMKKNMIKTPKLMQRNIILLNNKDFDELKEGDFYLSAENFKLLYVVDDVTIDKVKII
jgi:hypothetical protein